MADDLIRYDILTQDALRKVIRKVLEEVQRTGLPGEHHFFITFDTSFPGVRLSARMRERYPDEMTIVVQHSFWNLEVDENAFEIDLSFDDIRERLRIPYQAISGFFDPAVKFGLQFDTGNADLAAVEQPETRNPAQPPKTGGKSAATGPAITAQRKKADKEEKNHEGSEDGADVVSLDSFRKKK